MSTEEDRKRAMLWNAPPPPRQPKPGELLFEVQRASDKRFVRVELRFHGESYGWEVQFIEDDCWHFCGRGAFPTRALAVQWAEVERDFIATTRQDGDRSLVIGPDARAEDERRGHRPRGGGGITAGPSRGTPAPPSDPGGRAT